MTQTTRDSSWRLLVGAAPLGGVAALAWAVARGGELARSTAAPGLLALLAALGAAVAWWTARQRRGAPASTSVSVSDASAQAAAGRLGGVVALQGRAHALPDATPLVSPNGELCLWYRHGEPARPHGAASGSARPFLLVDDSGQCVVLPSGADISGSASGADDAPAFVPGVTADRRKAPRSPERLLRDGDRIQVVGRFVPVSAEAQALQAHAQACVAPAPAPAPLTSVMSNDPAAYRATRAAAARPLPCAGAAAAGGVAADPSAALPVISEPGGAQPFTIRVGAPRGQVAMYGVLAVADALVLLVAAGLACWASFGAR